MRRLRQHIYCIGGHRLVVNDDVFLHIAFIRLHDSFLRQHCDQCPGSADQLARHWR
jgi:hypothetical protein